MPVGKGVGTVGRLPCMHTCHRICSGPMFWNGTCLVTISHRTTPKLYTSDAMTIRPFEPTSGAIHGKLPHVPCTCVRVCACVCVRVCVCVCLFVGVWRKYREESAHRLVHTHTHTHTHAQPHTHTHNHTHQQFCTAAEAKVTDADTETRALLVLPRVRWVKAKGGGEWWQAEPCHKVKISTHRNAGTQKTQRHTRTHTRARSLFRPLHLLGMLTHLKTSVRFS